MGGDEIRPDWVIRNPMTGVLGGDRRDTQGRRPWEDSRRGWSDVPKSRNSRSYLKLEEAGRTLP